MRRVSSPSLPLIVCIALLASGLVLSAFGAVAPRPLHPVHAPRPGAPVIPSRISQAISDTDTVRLYRNTHPAANHKNDRGVLPDGYDIDHMFLQLQRSPEQEQELQAFIESQNDKDSPNFHHWLTAEEFGERYGVAPEDIDAVTGWLESHGFRINQVYTNRMLIDFSGPVASMRKAFHTEMHNLEVNGESHIGNMTDPQIPLALAPVIKGIVSLNDIFPKPLVRKVPDYTFAGCASATSLPTEPGTCYAITPQDNAVIYNLNPLWSAGYTGTGQTIAIVEDSNIYSTTDWTTYRSTFGLSGYTSGSLTTVHPGGCTAPTVNGAALETALDIEVATGTAPNAAIEMISCADTGSVTFGGIIAIQNLLNAAGPYPGVMSMSYGVCETDTGSAGVAGFYNAFQQAASQGISVFVSSGDAGPATCLVDIATSGYGVTPIGITGWGETPYNVSVGGTDFEDYYNFKKSANGGAALSTYWNATNTASYGSAKSYIPEMPWDDSCANALISEITVGAYTGYGASPGTCNNTTFDKTTNYLSTGAASGGPSTCATGSGGANESNYLVASPTCQGYPKPSFQTGSALNGGTAVYGQPTDGVRDIPDVSLFAANGDWGHYEVICFSDTAEGGTACTAGNPSVWTGLGGTSVASPMMAAIQALVNQKTASTWGSGVLKNYYQMGQLEYGSAGGTFQGSGCNSSTGSGSGCVFNDVTQGDINLACEDNGTFMEASCYLPASTHGVYTTDTVTSAAVINGGSGYTSAPTCTIAGPSNNNPYLSPTGSTIYAGGTQAACTATTNSASTTAVWTITFNTTYGTNYFASGAEGVTVGGVNYTFVTTLTAVNQILYTAATGATAATNIAKNIEATINAVSTQCGNANCFFTGQTANPLATATESTNVVTFTAKSAGYAGNFTASTYGEYYDENAELFMYATNTTPGQGPNYVSGITITTAGSGYAPETPVTLSGGGGSGAIAVANSNPGTSNNTSYQPTWGAAKGWDMATGLGTVNAYNLATNCVWTASSCPQTITVTQAPPASAGYGTSFNVAATASSGLAVAIATSGSCTGSGTSSASITMTSATGTCSVTFSQAGNTLYAAATPITDTTNATAGATTISVTSVSPNSEVYGQDAATTITAVLSWTGSGTAPTSGNVVIGGNGNGSYGVTSCGTPSGNTTTCTASYTPNSSDAAGNYTETAAFSADSNYAASSSSQTNNFSITSASAATTVACTPSGVAYGTSVTCTATINGQFNLLKGRSGVKRQDVTGTVAWSANTGCGTTNVTSGNPGTATCTTSVLPVGSDTVMGTYSGDSNHGGSSGSTSEVINQATSSISVTSVSPASEVYGQDAAVTITAVLSWSGSGSAPTAADVSIGGNGPSGYSATSCGAPSGNTMTCTATYTPTVSDAVGTYTETAAFSGDTNYSSSSSSQTNNFSITGATSSTVVTTSGSPSAYGSSVTFTATINGQNGLVKSRNGRVKSNDITGTVTWGAPTGCGTTTVTSGNPGIATCTTSILAVGTHTIHATYSGDANHSGSSGTVSQVVSQAATTIDVTSVSPASEVFGQNGAVTITAVLAWSGSGTAPNGNNVTIGGNGPSSYGNTNCSPASGNTITCTATYTPTVADAVGTYTESASFSGDTRYTSSSSPESNNFSISTATAATTVTSSLNPSNLGQSVTFTASINGEYNLLKGHKGRVKSQDVTGTVAWSSNTGCGTTNVTSGNPGIATCTTTTLPQGTDTITGTYSGDSNHSGSTGTLSGGQVVNSTTVNINVTSVSPASEVYGQDSTATITAVLSWSGSNTPTASDVSIGGNGPSGYSATSCGAPSGGTMTCTATYTPTVADAVGTYTESASFSGDSNYGAASSPQTNNFSITGATSSTVVTTSGSPSAYGSSVTFTATISGQYGLVKGRNGRVKSNDITGTVTWGTPTGCGTTTVTSGNPGIATCTTSILGVGTHTVHATYSGDSNHSGSSGTVSQVVSKATTTIDVTNVSPSAEDYGNNATVTITAVLSWSGSGTPTAADITIGGNGPSSYGTTSCGTPSGNTITCTNTYTPTSSDTPASYTETASFSGDAHYTSSSSPETNNFTINSATAATAVACTPNPSAYGASVTCTATINGEFNLLKGRRGVKRQDVTGTVAWSANTGCGTTTVTSGNPGVATCTTSVLPVGSDTVMGTYSGDSNHSGSSGSTSQVVNQAATSISVTSVSPASEGYGQDATVTITAVLSWSGSGTPTAANVTIGGNGPSGYGTTSCGSPSGNTMTCTNTYTPTVADGVGSYTESASFSGDTNYTSSSSSQTNNFSIGSATAATTVTSSQNPSGLGESVTFTASINGEYGLLKGRRGVKRQDVTGTVAWSSNTGCGTTNVTSGNPGVATCTTSTLVVGTDTITAAYSGDSNHSGSTGTLSGGQVVRAGTTSISVTGVSPSSEVYGLDSPVSITAVLSWTGVGPAPTASHVSIGGNGNGTYGATSCGSPSGNAMTCTASYTPSGADALGSYTESASFSGDSNYGGASSSQTNNFSITSATAGTAVACSPNPSTYGTSVTCTATINGQYGQLKGRVRSNNVTGTVAWSSNTGCGTTSVTSGNPGVATCVTTILNAGSDTVMGTYSGDANHSGSSGSTSQTVTQASQTINVTFIPTTATLKSSFTVAASASSGLSLAYTSSGGCTNAGATYTMAMTGHVACDVIINQAGNSNYTAAPQFSQNVTVAAAVVPTKSLTGPATAAYLSTFNVTATSDSFTVPTFTATPATVCTISGTTVTMITGTGTCTVKASWAANYIYAAATATHATGAEKLPSTVNWSNPAAITYGTPLSGTQLNATATDPNNNPLPGTFVYTPVAGKILAAGTQTLKVKFTPTANKDYTTVMATDVTILVNPVGTTTAITSSSPNPSTVNTTVTFDFTVTQAISNPTTAPGVVTLTASTGETCHGTLASGAGHCTIKFTTSGVRTLTASYPGNANNQASTSAPFTQTVN